MQLKIASMGKARLERGYPSAKKLVSEGVPKGLAYALAPFQRGGVDFINDKEGRALIADGTYIVFKPINVDMGIPSIGCLVFKNRSISL
jgi:hypothetical protein